MAHQIQRPRLFFYKLCEGPPTQNSLYNLAIIDKVATLDGIQEMIHGRNDPRGERNDAVEIEDHD
ncbi:unnamed protein product [Sphenostylis stenocarpa]|uniref:Uncharacterized protein n=1 Tax=Sphenostylis stenocarpa TaxID=92480 RepID=A0AA86S959_9FABA|nr:unnamed protein product [Sphenostylis stenocarpa]